MALEMSRKVKKRQCRNDKLRKTDYNTTDELILVVYLCYSMHENVTVVLAVITQAALKNYNAMLKDNNYDVGY